MTARQIPIAAHGERREIVRKRSWTVRSLNEILAVIEGLNTEKAVGNLSLNFGPGGVVETLTFEERTRAS
jgi:hypothetical protein